MFLIRTDLDEAVQKWRDIIFTSLPSDRLGAYVALRHTYGNSVREALDVIYAFDAQKPARTFDGAVAPQNRWAEVFEQEVLRRPLRTKRFPTNTRGALRSPPRCRHIRPDQAD